MTYQPSGLIRDEGMLKTAMDDPNRPFCNDCNRWMERNSTAESGRTRYLCGGCGTRTTASPDSPFLNQNIGYSELLAEERLANLRTAIQKGANRFVVTSAANNCEVDYNAFNSLKRLCEDRGAHLIVIPIHYKNISLYTASQQYRKSWAKILEPYIIDQPLRIGPKLWVRADISIQATAAEPLSGMAPLTGDKWSIFGHSQLGMEPIATPLEQLPGRMYTTGAITKKSYSKSKMGAKAAFHHVCGALLIEVSGKKVFIRQLNADHKGHIYDLTDLYTPTETFRDQPALSLTTGDEHVKWMAKNVKKATYLSKSSLVNTTKVEFIIRHDVLDGYAGSHHHVGHYTTEYKKWWHGDANYRKELEQVVGHINETTPVDWNCTNILVKDSNHHEHLDSWLERADDRRDHLNADLICELRNAQREAIRAHEDYSAFRLYLEPRLTVPAEFTNPNSPFMLAGVDFSQHGHKGAGGSRGSAKGFANTTHKATIGHSHSARIVKSVYQVGKSTGTLEYESGLSAHTNTHCLQYQNGKRTLIDIFGISWRATNRIRTGGLNVPGTPL